MYLYIPPRIVTFLCFLQVFFIVFGYLVTGFCVRELQFSADSPSVDAFISGVYTYGPWCLAVPFIWGILTLGSIRASRESISITKCLFGIGLIVTILLFVAFSTTVIDSLLVCLNHGIVRLS